MFKRLLYRLNRLPDRKPKKISKVFYLSLIIFCLFGSFVLIKSNLAQEAQTTTDPLQGIGDLNSAKKNPSSEAFEQNQTTSTIHTFVSALIGTPPGSMSELEAYVNDYKIGKNIGAISQVNKMIAYTYSPPASGVEYIASLKNNFIGKPAYAQGVGFEGLSPLLPIWKGFRNVVYYLSAIFFIILGLMVMLRVKTSPQTVITIQSAIPQVVTTLILVTFSYAIAGLLIDLSAVLQGVGLTVLFSVQGKGLSENLFRTLNPLDLLGTYSFRNLSDAGLWDIGKLIGLMIPKNLLLLLSTVIAAIIGGILGALTGGVGLIPAAVGTFLIVLLIISVIVLWKTLQFFFGLIKCYVNVMLKIILGPLEIGLGAIPGMKMGFNSWIWNLFANLSVFPISLLFLALVNIIIEKTGWTSNLWTPNMVKFNIPGTALSITSGLSGGLLPVALGFSALAIASKLPEIIPQIVFSIKPSPLEQIADFKNSAIYKTGKSTMYGYVGQSISEGASSGNVIGLAADNLKKIPGGDLIQSALGGAVSNQGKT